MRCPKRPARAGYRLAQCITAIALVLTGCDPTAPLPLGPISDVASTPLGALAAGDIPLYGEAESNEAFDSANGVVLSATGRASVDAAIDLGGDIDTFAIGPAAAGDQIVLTMRVSAGLPLTIGFFDEAHDLIEIVRVGASNGAPYYVDATCRADTAGVYIVVAALDGSSALGTYTMTIERSAGPVSGTNPQTIVLDFDGDPGVSIAGAAPFVVPAFDAANIGPAFAGKTATIQELVKAKVQAHFSGLNVTIVTSDEPGATTGSPTTLYFGTYNADLLGLADSVDAYNADLTQNAIIFTDTFSLFTSLNPSVDEIAQALANVASHEAGHLLGLWHVQDSTLVMDISATARQMLRPQTFGHGSLHDTVLGVGWQNAPNLLARAVGGVLKTNTNNSRIATVDDEWRAEFDFEIDRRWLSTCLHDPQPVEP